jgi:hypothetical protein
VAEIYYHTYSTEQHQEILCAGRSCEKKNLPLSPVIFGNFSSPLQCSADDARLEMFQLNGFVCVCGLFDLIFSKVDEQTGSAAFDDDVE